MTLILTLIDMELDRYLCKKVPIDLILFGMTRHYRLGVILLTQLDKAMKRIVKQYCYENKLYYRMKYKRDAYLFQFMGEMLIFNPDRAHKIKTFLYLSENEVWF